MTAWRVTVMYNRIIGISEPSKPDRSKVFSFMGLKQQLPSSALHLWPAEWKTEAGRNPAFRTFSDGRKKCAMDVIFGKNAEDQRAAELRPKSTLGSNQPVNRIRPKDRSKTGAQHFRQFVLCVACMTILVMFQSCVDCTEDKTGCGSRNTNTQLLT